MAWLLNAVNAFLAQGAGAPPPAAASTAQAPLAKPGPTPPFFGRLSQNPAAQPIPNAKPGEGTVEPIPNAKPNDPGKLEPVAATAPDTAAQPPSAGKPVPAPIAARSVKKASHSLRQRSRVHRHRSPRQPDLHRSVRTNTSNSIPK